MTCKLYLLSNRPNTHIIHFVRLNKIEKENGPYVKETTARTKSRQQPKATNGSSTHRENPAHGGGVQLDPKKIVCYLLTFLTSMEGDLHATLSRIHPCIFSLPFSKVIFLF